jgi:hypothetical protein
MLKVYTTGIRKNIIWEYSDVKDPIFPIYYNLFLYAHIKPPKM